MASTYLTFTQQTPSTAEAQKFTISMWVKRCGLASIQGLYGNTYSNTHRGYLYFDSSDRFVFFDSSGTSLVTSRKFRDITGFYHIVVATDTTQGTASNRVKIYVNGVQETAFDTETYPNQNQDLKIMNTTNTPYMGRIVEAGTSYYLEGILSHVHFTQGYVYQASDFGETDSTTGEWKINTSPTISNYGTNGFWWLKDSIATTDHSPNSNTFTVGGGTLTKTEDCPSNVFATFNPLSGADTMAVNSTFSNGNNTVVCSGTVYNPFGSTIGVNKGKYYAEFKTNVAPGDGMIGIFAKLGASGNYLGSQTHQYSWYNASGGSFKNNSSNLATSVGTYTTNDIIGIALDCDNNKLYFHKNGTYMTYGGGTMNPTSGTYGISITDPDDTDLGFYFMSAMDWGGSTRGNWSANFGNGYFGTTAVATNSGNGYAGAEGKSIFNYQPPTGYSALSTKGLNE